MDPDQVPRLDLRGEGQSPPFDPVGNTSSKLGGSHGGATVGMEVGVVVGIIVLVVLTVTGIFLWRARKSRAAAGPGADMAPDPEHDLGAHRPTPPPKEERPGSSAETGLASDARAASITFHTMARMTTALPRLDPASMTHVAGPQLPRSSPILSWRRRVPRPTVIPF